MKKMLSLSPKWLWVEFSWFHSISAMTAGEHGLNVAFCFLFFGVFILVTVTQTGNTTETRTHKCRDWVFTLAKGWLVKIAARCPETSPGEKIRWVGATFILKMRLWKQVSTRYSVNLSHTKLPHLNPVRIYLESAVSESLLHVQTISLPWSCIC